MVEASRVLRMHLLEMLPSIVVTVPLPLFFSTTPTWSIAPTESVPPQSKNTMSPGCAFFTLAVVPEYHWPAFWKR